MYNKEYLESIKKKLDVMNQLNGFNSHGSNLKAYDNYDTDPLNLIGASGKAWMEKNPRNLKDPEQIENPNTGLVFF